MLLARKHEFSYLTTQNIIKKKKNVTDFTCSKKALIFLLNNWIWGVSFQGIRIHLQEKSPQDLVEEGKKIQFLKMLNNLQGDEECNRQDEARLPVHTRQKGSSL